jgi:hypothetical protein
MPAVSPELLQMALAAAVGIIVLLITAQVVRTWLRRHRLADRFARARQGESRAHALLEAHGYAVLDAQLTRSYTHSIDGQGVVVPLRADFVVERDGLRFVAEAKTGAHATQIRTPATRRQLLEYRVAYDVDGVLLVDADKERVHVVRFPFIEHPARETLSRWGWIVIGVGLIALVVTAWRTYLGASSTLGGWL